MKNFVSSGKSFPIAAPAGGVVSGRIQKIGDIFVVPATTANEGELFEGFAEGIFDLPKASVSIDIGQKLYWITASNNVTTTATGNAFIGYATASKVAGDAMINVRLSQ